MFNTTPGSLPKVLRYLIIATAVIFVLDFLTQGRFISPWLGLSTPRVLGAFELWRLLSYAFVHSVSSPFHILFNMLMLYMFGIAVLERTGEKIFFFMYLGAAIFAALFSVLWDKITGGAPLYVGASGAVYAIMVAFACYYPRQTLLIFFVVPMQAVWAVVLFIGIDLLLLTRSDGIAHITHLGGALFGYLCVRYMDKIDGLFVHWENRQQKQQEKKAIRIREEMQRSSKQVDLLLAKISQKGIQSLSRSEKKILDQASQAKRANRPDSDLEIRKIIPGNFDRK